MQKLKHNAHLVIIIAVLFVTGLSFASAFRSQGNLLVSVVSADDDEEDRAEEEDDREDDSDNDRDEDDDEDENDNDNDNEDEDRDEDEDEQRTYRTRTTATQLRAQEADNDEDEDEDEDENEDADDVKEEISELREDIQKVEIRIDVLASNGFSMDAFRSNLAEVKGLLAQAESQAVSNPRGAEDTLETADHKLERLKKLVKMSLKDDDEDDESVEEAAEEIGELKRDIAKLENRLNLASAGGMDVSAYKNVISEAKSMLSQAEAKLSAGNYIEAESIAELADKKLDRIDDLFEDDDEDEDDDDIAKEYKNEVAMFVHNLKAIGEMEGGIGQQVSVVAQAQNDSQSKIESSIDDINSRGGFVRFLIGPNYGSIAEIQTAITENQTRINVLTDLVAQVTDPVVKQVLQDQIKNFQQENVRLQTFITENGSGISLFGWLVKIFS